MVDAISGNDATLGNEALEAGNWHHLDLDAKQELHMTGRGPAEANRATLEGCCSVLKSSRQAQMERSLPALNRKITDLEATGKSKDFCCHLVEAR